MKIHLDHVQRLNLHDLLGAQRGDVATIRALSARQDKLALSPEKEQVTELKRDFIGGQERVIWNPASSIPTKELDLADAELTRSTRCWRAGPPLASVWTAADWSRCSTPSGEALLPFPHTLLIAAQLLQLHY